MPRLKKEIFMRPNRMTHRFGEGDDPYTSSQYFDAPYPNGIKTVNANGRLGFNIKQHGQHVYTEPLSPVAKFKGGNASLSGPALDVPDQVAERPPVSSVRRKVTAGAK